MSSDTKIKHLVLSGGGIIGYKIYSILRESAKAGFWNINDIKTIHGTSIGGIIAAMIALNFDWDVLDDFIIKRPWHQVFKFDMNSIFHSFQTKGIMNIHVIELFYEPLFKAKDLDMKITMKEFYEYTGIDVHLFATEFNDTIPIDISWKTHPDWTVIESIYCSCCLPFLFSPYFKDTKIYYDGGVFYNYPISQCILNIKNELSDGETINLDEIMGINAIINEQPFTEDSTLFDYITHLMKKFIKSSNERIKNEKMKSLILNGGDIIEKDNEKIKNEIVINSINISLYDIYLAVSNMDIRIQLIEDGTKIWSKFYSSEDL